ncbi:MAG: SdpI family protein [Halobacteriota archaeon]|nr:SdpI family protein [Halobacteriota archaeon]
MMPLELIIGSVFGLELVGIGILYHYKISKMGPNPWFGLRSGYTLIDDESWYKTNKYIGKILIIGGISLMVISSIAYAVSLDVQKVLGVSLIVIGVLFILLAVLSHIKSVRIAEELNKREEIEMPLKMLEPIKVHFFWMAIPVIEFLLLISVSLLYYERLPQEIIFSFDGGGEVATNPGIDKNIYMTLIVLLGVFFALMVPIIIWVGKRSPIYFYKGQLNLGEEDLIKFNLMFLISIAWSFILPHVNIINYNLNKEPLLSLPALLSAIFAFILLPPLGFLALRIYKFKDQKKVETENKGVIR